jgi:basic membrane protein A
VEDYEEYPDESTGVPEDEFDALLAVRRELSQALKNEHDPIRRQELLNRLSENRAEILQMQRDLGIDSPQSAALRTSRSYLVDPWSADTSEQPATPAYHYSAAQAPQVPMGMGPQTQSGPGFRGVGPMPTQSTASTGGRVNRSLVAFGVTAVIGLVAAFFAFQFFGGDGGETTPDEVAAGGALDEDVQGLIDQIMSVLAGMGLNGVVATEQDGVIHLAGMVATEAERTAAIGAVQALAGDRTVDASQLTVANTEVAGPSAEPAEGTREAALQAELNRVLASTPIIFDLGQTELTELHIRILNNVATILLAYPEAVVKVVGYTDDQGTEEANRAVSLARAENVKNYLVSQGVADGALQTEARGEDTATGSQAIGVLERRVEFEVLAAPGSGALAPNENAFRIGIVAPSARNDLAFTQSMVDAVNVIAAERGNVEVSITDSTFVVEDAAAAIRDYATQGYDLVIAHGSQFGAELVDIAPEYPEVAFAWGTASDTFGLPNVYAYDVASEEGGYVMGAQAARLTQSGVIGVVGPIEVGDAARYVNGFKAGAEAENPGVQVLVTYTQSFSDLTLAADTARSHIDAGSDVMTGSAQMVVGAVSVASERGVKWFGTQANQSSLDPNIVVASQVYHWEVILREIVTDIDAGTPSGRAYTANLANGGLVIEYNPAAGVPADIQARGDELVNAISTQAISVPS